MNITKRYVHPQEHTILEAMERAREVKGGHTGQQPDQQRMLVPAQASDVG
jgi:hypothetical protein